MKKTTLLMVLALVIASCTGGNKPKEPADPNGGCKEVCKHLSDCEDFGPTPGPLERDGRQHPVPCEVWLCQTEGMKIACLLKATSCPQATLYQQRGCSAQ
jgi:hypothetical protein